MLNEQFNEKRFLFIYVVFSIFFQWVSEYTSKRTDEVADEEELKTNTR